MQRRALAAVLFAATLVVAAARAQDATTTIATELPVPRAEELLARAPMRRLRPVARGGRTLEMRLEAPIDALFVPATTDDPDGWRREIAAYRVARCLGMVNVPPAVPRRIARRELEGALDPDFEDVRDDLVRVIRFDDGGATWGASVLRVADARPSGLGNWRRLERRLALLGQGRDIDRGRETQVSDLAHAVLFDYLIAHPGRWDGSPIPGSPNGARLFVIDHADAFATNLGSEADARMRERMKRVEKVGRWFTDGLLRCDERALRRVLAGAGEPLVSEAQLAALLDRRETILSWIVALRDAFGEEAVFVLR